MRGVRRELHCAAGRVQVLGVEDALGAGTGILHFVRCSSVPMQVTDLPQQCKASIPLQGADREGTRAHAVVKEDKQVACMGLKVRLIEYVRSALNSR